MNRYYFHSPEMAGTYRSIKVTLIFLHLAKRLLHVPICLGDFSGVLPSFATFAPPEMPCADLLRILCGALCGFAFHLCPLFCSCRGLGPSFNSIMPRHHPIIMPMPMWPHIDRLLDIICQTSQKKGAHTKRRKPPMHDK